MVKMLVTVRQTGLGLSIAGLKHLISVMRRLSAQTAPVKCRSPQSEFRRPDDGSREQAKFSPRAASPRRRRWQHRRNARKTRISAS